MAITSKIVDPSVIANDASVVLLQLAYLPRTARDSRGSGRRRERAYV
jgi:hypothetical protein